MRALVRGAVCVLLAWAVAASTGCGSETSTGQAADNASTGNGDAKGTAADSAAAPGSKKKTRKRRERTTSVRVARAFRGDLVVPVIAEGTIRARHSTELRTEIAGRLVRIVAGEGQFVRRGALIARLDDREYAVAEEEARSKYFQALSLLAIEDESLVVPERPAELQKQIDELTRLEKKGAITREERLAREVALDLDALKEGYFRVDVIAGRSGIAAARAALERARLELERTELRAPFDGVITDLEISAGEQMTVGQTICTLVNNTDIEARVGVLESDIGKLAVGRPALLAVPALAETLRVTVDVISPRFDRESRTCQVLLRLKNEDGRVRPGMFARAIIAGETFSDRLLVPKEAILTRDGRPLLFKVEEARAKWVYIKVGRQNDRLAEITGVLQGGSLSPGEQVVVTNHLTLAHEAKVKVKKVLPIRDPWAPAN
ncbi:MAG: efflux RND transporter periplasmic adaptor subunit [Candidatus Krumholzibacteriia bacterium]